MDAFNQKLTADDALAVTPSDSAANNFSKPFSAVYVGSGGNVVIVKKDGTTITYYNVPSGGKVTLQGVRVNATNTTATLMNAEF